MDQYVPPLVAIATGVVVVALCFVLRIPFFIIGFLSVCMVAYVLQDHFMRFSHDYATASAPAFFKANASILIITLVIVMCLGFLVLRFGPSAVVTNAPYARDQAAPQQGILGGLFGRVGNMFRRSSSYPRNESYRNDSDPYARSSAFKYI